MPTLVKTPPGHDLLQLVVAKYDHFTEYATATKGYSTVATDGGACAVSDGRRGILAITASDGTAADNDETYLKGTNETALFAANSAIYFGVLAQYAEANTDDANIILGFKDAVAANTLVDDGGGPPSSYSGACFFKVDGATVWSVESSLGATQTTTVTNITAGGSAYHLFEIEFRAIDATTGEVSFLYDGAVVCDTNGRPIKHQITYTSATEMQECMGVKNGGGNLETLNIDAVAFRQTY